MVYTSNLDTSGMMEILNQAIAPQMLWGYFDTNGSVLLAEDSSELTAQILPPSKIMMFYLENSDAAAIIINNKPISETTPVLTEGTNYRVYAGTYEHYLVTLLCSLSVKDSQLKNIEVNHYFVYDATAKEKGAIASSYPKEALPFINDQIRKRAEEIKQMRSK